MGYRFRAEYANIVHYLTTLTMLVPPRLTTFQLQEFLFGLAHPYQESRLISSFPDWLEAINRATERALRDLDSISDSDIEPSGMVVSPRVIRLLAELKGLMSGYTLFGVGIGAWEHDAELRAFLEYAALSSGRHGFFLLPSSFEPSEGFAVLDPFPGVALLAEQPEKLPGVLFWSSSGTSALASLKEVNDLYSKLQQVMGNLERTDRVLSDYKIASSAANILHLSDVHFGTEAALQNEPYLSAHLQSISSTLKRTVITGDLFNEPKREAALAFRNFRSSLSRQRLEDIIVIPGNHDQKWMGNFGSHLGELAELEWSNLIIDEGIGCVFFCFDSSKSADLARGRVTREQLINVATQFETKCLQIPDIRNYLGIALVHHHPFSFETTKETIVSRALAKIKVTDELFLKMDDAEGFLQWCRNRGISLILHGHKHVPRYVQDTSVLRDGRLSIISSVGCGTSLGMEGKPLSYNIISRNERAQTWTVSFFSDPGDGSGFTREFISLHTA